MKIDFVKHTQKMLFLGKRILSGNPSLFKETGDVNIKGDHTIEMDIKIENSFIDYIKKHRFPVNIFSEEKGFFALHKKPKYLVVFDPLDGSTNYKIGKRLLPFGILIAIYKGTNPKLKDVVSAGALEYSRNLAWIYDGSKTSEIDGKEIKLNTNWLIHPSTPVYLDLYYKQNYEIYRPLAQQIFIRNTGSTIGNLSYILSNTASCLGHTRMRPEEIGAVYALIKGAGGIVVNHQGKDLGEEKFSPDQNYQILAGSKTIVDFIVKKI